MAFDFWKSEDKSVDCDISSQDGIMSAVCKRTKKQKDGTETTDGQTVTMTADPNNDCNVAYSGHLNVSDSDGFKTFDPLAKRLQKGCKRGTKKGLLPQKAQ